MLEGKPVVVLSYSTRYREEVAKPVARSLAPHGFRAILVGEEPLPAGVESNPNEKVEWFFRHADMAVFLATPDDRLESGEVYTRPNIVDEHRLGLQLGHLRHKLMVFKAAGVRLPSNINPVYERLPLDDPDWITAKIVEQARAWGVLPTSEPPEADRSPQSSEGTDGTAIPAEDTDTEATAQAVAALAAAAERLNGQGGDVGPLRRAELAVAGLVAESGTTDTLGVHLANSIFARRHEVRPRRSERILLLRTYLRHVRDDNVPGLVWLKDLSRRAAIDLLVELARDDGDEEVRAQALRILGRLRAPSSLEAARRLLRPLLDSDDAGLRGAALDHLRERGDARLRSLLDDARLLERDRQRARHTAALLELPRAPGKVMARYVEDADVRGNDVEASLLAAAARIGRPLVERALRSPVKEVRRLGLQLAERKRCLSVETAQELIAAERSPSLRLLAVRAAMASGGPVDLALLAEAARARDDDTAESSAYDAERALEHEIAMRMPADEIAAQLEWTSVVGPALYEALGRRDRTWAERHVRRDLANDFARLKDEGRKALLRDRTATFEAGLRRQLTADEREGIARAADDDWQPWVADDRLGRYVLATFRRAALRILAVHGKPADVRLARRFADDRDYDVRAEALRVLDRFGTARDAGVVLDLVDRMYGEDRELAAELALRLAYKKDKLDVLARLREHHAVRIWAVARLADVPGGVDVAADLVQDDDADVRLAAADVVWDAVRPEFADRLLSVYMEQRHYYNVVRKIDERLYAPGWLRRALPSA